MKQDPYRWCISYRSADVWYATGLVVWVVSLLSLGFLLRTLTPATAVSLRRSFYRWCLKFTLPKRSNIHLMVLATAAFCWACSSMYLQELHSILPVYVLCIEASIHCEPSSIHFKGLWALFIRNNDLSNCSVKLSTFSSLQNYHKFVEHLLLLWKPLLQAQ